jgi:hypothetical protein
MRTAKGERTPTVTSTLLGGGTTAGGWPVDAVGVGPLLGDGTPLLGARVEPFGSMPGPVPTPTGEVELAGPSHSAGGASLPHPTQTGSSAATVTDAAVTNAALRRARRILRRDEEKMTCALIV